MPSTVGLAIPAFLLALPLCGLAATSAKPVAEDSASITGTIIDDAGQPAKDAAVFVYSARLKQGYAIVCPTCFVDCGKHTETDAQGRFSITGLNPALKFRLLVLKQGFTATAKGGVDPAEGPLPPIKISPRAPSTDESKIVRGRITDVSGSPIAGAVVEPVGATQGSMTAIGSLDWIDQLAVSNASGEFAIVSTQPVDKIQLKISPRGLAPKLVTELPGPATNSIVLTEGATIIGRLVEPNATPIANAEVVMISHGVNGQSFSDMRVGTDKDGSFAFTNVPPRRIWGIYPSFESMHSRNLTAGLHWCETVADRQVVNVGRITLLPGFSVKGKVDLLDKKDVPPGMHATIDPVWTVTNRLAVIASDGTFEFKTLAPGIYSLNVSINGYAPTGDSPQSILVESDRNVTIHMARLP